MLKSFVIPLSAFVFLWVGLCSPLWARTLNVPSQYPDIPAAIAAAAAGDEIRLASGVYKGNFELRPQLSLVGEQDSAVILAPDGRYALPTLTAAEGCTVENITFIHAITGSRAALLLKDCTAVIRHNIFKENYTAAIAVEGGSSQPRIADNQILENQGTGIIISFGSPVIENNNINSNHGSGISATNALPTIEGNLISYNTDAGISLIGTKSVDLKQLSPLQAQVRDNYIVDNYGPAIICDLISPMITGNTLRSKAKPTLLLFNSSAVIRQNEFTTTGMPAIQVNYGAPIIEGNTISGARRFPILGGSKDAVIRNNKIENEWNPGFGTTDWLTQPKTQTKPESPASGAPGS